MLVDDKKFENIDEAISFVKTMLSDDELKELKSFKKKDLINLHQTFGRKIRNSIGLWSYNKDLVTKIFGKNGHPDDLSMMIIEKIWKE
jgi:hypothetical protein